MSKNSILKTGKDVLDHFKKSNYKELEVRNLKGETINGADSYKDLKVCYVKSINDKLLAIMNTNKTFY